MKYYIIQVQPCCVLLIVLARTELILSQLLWRGCGAWIHVGTSRLFILYHAHHLWGTWLLVEEKRNMMWNHHHFCSFLSGEQSGVRSGGWCNEDDPTWRDCPSQFFLVSGLGEKCEYGQFFWHCSLLSWENKALAVVTATIFSLVLEAHVLLAAAALGQWELHEHFFHEIALFLNTFAVSIVGLSVCFLISLLFF